MRWADADRGSRKVKEPWRCVLGVWEVDGNIGTGEEAGGIGGEVVARSISGRSAIVNSMQTDGHSSKLPLPPHSWHRYRGWSSIARSMKSYSVGLGWRESWLRLRPLEQMVKGRIECAHKYALAA